MAGEAGYWFTNDRVPQSWIRGLIAGREFGTATEAYVEIYDQQDANRVDGAPKEREVTIGAGGRRALNQQRTLLLLLMGGRSLQRVTLGAQQPQWIAYIEWEIKRLLRTVPGVSEINNWGGEVKQYQIVVDPRVLSTVVVYWSCDSGVLPPSRRSELSNCCGENLLLGRVNCRLLRSFFLVRTDEANGATLVNLPETPVLRAVEVSRLPFHRPPFE